MFIENSPKDDVHFVEILGAFSLNLPDPNLLKLARIVNLLL